MHQSFYGRVERGVEAVASKAEALRFENMCYNVSRFAGGAVAQLEEHHVRNVGVVGSNPICSTKNFAEGEILEQSTFEIRHSKKREWRLRSSFDFLFSGPLPFLISSIKKSLLTLLIIVAGAGFFHLPALAQSDKIRVKVEVVGDGDVDREAANYIDKAFREIADVQLVDEDPAVYIHVIARRLVTNRGRKLGYVIASASSEIIEMVVEGGHPFACSDYNGLWLETGPNLRALCYQCAEAMNGGVIDRMRGERQ
jgi:hypothetical protein